MPKSFYSNIELAVWFRRALALQLDTVKLEEANEHFPCLSEEPKLKSFYRSISLLKNWMLSFYRNLGMAEAKS